MRRFIAGAVCPQCRAMDRIVIEELEGMRRQRCVACGHTDTLRSSGTPEPATRLARKPRRDEPAQAVRIVEPPKVKR